MSLHRIGFAVKVLGDGGLPSHDTRRWQSGPHLSVSLDRLEAILGYLDRHDLRMYRLPTALVPYATHPDLPRFHAQVKECAPRLAAVGERVRELDVRLSSHPGQYTVLNSTDERVRDLAVSELDAQAELFDAMELPAASVVVLHVGGARDGKAAGADRFCSAFARLSEPAQRRLAIENDDRTYALVDVLGIAARLGVPVVWDALHHHCNDPDAIDEPEALDRALATWAPGVVPKLHYSSPRLDVGERKRRDGRRVIREPVLPQPRAHADLIDPLAFEAFARRALAGRAVDVMIEAKAKDLAVLRLREQLAGRGFGWREGRLVVG